MASSAKDAAEACGVVIQASDVERHNAVGVGERYHGPLRRVNAAHRFDEASLPPDMALRLAVKEINYAMAPNGLVTSLLVYARIYRFTGHEKRPTPTERKSTVASALEQATKAASDARINGALRSKIPPLRRRSFSPGTKSAFTVKDPVSGKDRLR